MTISVIKMVTTVFEASFKAKKRGHDVFVRYSPHVQLLAVDIHLGGWRKHTDADIYKTVYLEKPTAISKLNKIVKIIENLE